MDCNEARPLLDAALDRELSGADARRIEQHLARCADCRREAQALRAVSDATRTAEYFRAPEALRARVLKGLLPVAPASAQAAPQAAANGRTGEPATPGVDARPSPARPERSERPGAGWFGWATALRPAARGARSASAPGRGAALGWPAAIALAALALGLSASVALIAHRSSATAPPFVDELVASHVRAQLSGHDIDVVSSDQHTVKPWFNGRLDYAPPVEDLAENGFALTGGRLDYLNHQRVAVLVYRYRKHIIDLYVMPAASAGATSAPPALTSDGYALARWQDHGMVWWAVSDAEPAVLAQLHAALAARLGPQTEPSS
jgi:anti-sigma factor (TIGR02949 family)